MLHIHIVGLKSDGTLEAIGNNFYGQCDVHGSNWTDIIQVVASTNSTIALTSTGRILLAGEITDAINMEDLMR